MKREDMKPEHYYKIHDKHYFKILNDGHLKWGVPLPEGDALAIGLTLSALDMLQESSGIVEVSRLEGMVYVGE